MSASSHAPLTAPPAGPVSMRGQRAAAYGWISHNVRYLERWVAWSIAVYTAWVTVFSYPGEPSAWVLVLYAGLIGKWAEIRVARQQWEMTGRGLALVMGAYVIQTQLPAQIGDVRQLIFFWLSITSLCYTLMLKPAWGACVVAFAVVGFAAGSLQAPRAPSLPELMGQAGFLVIFPLLLTMKFGAVMRQPDDALEVGRIDRSTALYNQDGFTAHGDEMLAACELEGQPLSVAVFDCADLLEVRAIYGNRMARTLAARIVDKLSALTVDRGLAARTGAAEFSVVLPDMDRDKALAAIHRALGHPLRIELDAADSEIVLVPSFMVETAIPNTASVEDLHVEMRRKLALARDYERRHQHHMQRRRKHHSRPMPISEHRAAA